MKAQKIDETSIKQHRARRFFKEYVLLGIHIHHLNAQSKGDARHTYRHCLIQTYLAYRMSLVKGIYSYGKCG